MVKQVFVVVGGGVAGVCCVEELCSLLESPTCDVDLEILAQITEAFDVEESETTKYFQGRENIRIIQEDVVGWNPDRKVLFLRDFNTLNYDKLCIGTGAVPKQSFKNPNLITLRDLNTVNNLNQKLQKSKRVVLIGNGGIASELVFELVNVEIVWVIRHSSISATYFDEAAAKFFESKLQGGAQKDIKLSEVKSDRYKIVCEQQTIKVSSGTNSTKSDELTTNFAEHNDSSEMSASAAVGPHWWSRLEHGSNYFQRKVEVVRDVEMVRIFESVPKNANSEQWHQFNKQNDFLPNNPDFTKWNLWVQLSNGEIVGCDLVVELTGVIPNSGLELGEDLGILVNSQMKTNIHNVFAAGDICTAAWESTTPHWKQIRLWTQARHMGIFAARCMLYDDMLLDIALEIFSHVTTFFGYKVILLGDFNATKLEKPYELHFRITENEEFVKILTKNHQIRGAVLIGETDLEETMENLILNETNVEQIEADLLNPTVDLEDYFD